MVVILDGAHTYGSSSCRALFLKSDPLAAVSDARIHDQFLPGVARCVCSRDVACPVTN
jgi:hypothetical protein